MTLLPFSFCLDLPLPKSHEHTEDPHTFILHIKFLSTFSVSSSRNVVNDVVSSNSIQLHNNIKIFSFEPAHLQLFSPLPPSTLWTAKQGVIKAGFRATGVVRTCTSIPFSLEFVVDQFLFVGWNRKEKRKYSHHLPTLPTFRGKGVEHKETSFSDKLKDQDQDNCT